MAEGRNEDEQVLAGEDSTPPEAVAGGSQWHPLTTAALIGGAVAATAGAYLGTRALARRNSRADGRRLNSVMATAITALDLSNGSSEPNADDIIILQGPGS